MDSVQEAALNGLTGVHVVSIAENLGSGIFELEGSRVEALDLEVAVRDGNLGGREVKRRRVLNGDCHLSTFSGVPAGNGAVKIRRVGLGALGPLISLKARHEVDTVLHEVAISLSGGVKSIVNSFSVVISDSLLGGSSDGVVVLVNSHHIKHGVFGFKNILNRRIFSFLSEANLGSDLVLSMGIVGGSSSVSLVVGTGREVAGPVGIGLVGVGEHIVGLGRPLHVMLLESIDIGTRSSVLEVVLIAVVSVHVLDHVVKTTVVPLGVNELEVAAPDDEDFIGQIVLSSEIDILHQVLGLFFGIEVLVVIV
mmetsp:Transcript_520/g.542  ORF Transcript_520/g.542 Transcript_520/m.542 type:complete len:309 (-) Transcript_520:790-1716(-)